VKLLALENYFEEKYLLSTEVLTWLRGLTHPMLRPALVLA